MLDTATAVRVATSLGSIGAALVKDELSGVIAGDVYWVDSNGTGAGASATIPGTFDQPFSTLTYAISRCTASKGDVIFAKPGHVETTTAIAWSKAGVKVVGLGYGRNRPTFTATTAATDLINVTAANGILQNVRLVGAASGVTSLLDGSSAATDFQLLGCELVAAATPLSLITWSGQRPVIKDLVVTQSANGVDFIVDFEAGVDSFLFSDWDVFCPNGIDNALIRSGAFAHEGYIIKNMTVVGIDTLLVSFASSTAAGPDGLFRNGDIMASAALTSIEDMVAAATSLGMAFTRLYATDATGKRGGQIPLTSAS